MGAQSRRNCPHGSQGVGLHAVVCLYKYLANHNCICVSNRMQRVIVRLHTMRPRASISLACCCSMYSSFL